MNTKIETDIIIIGAGPVGLFAVFEAGLLKMRCHLIDALPQPGGQLTEIYPKKPIYDIPGFPRIDAADLVTRLQAQAAPFQPVYHLGQQVQSVVPRDNDSDGGGFTVKTSAGTTIACRAVIVAAGVGAFGPNRPPLAGIEAFEGKSVFYYITRREDFRGKRVVIAGGGDSAVDWALSLAELAERVLVVHRRPKFRAAPESEARLKALVQDGKVELVVPYQLHGLEGTDGKLSAVVVATLDGQERRLEADALLPFFGLSTALGPIADWGLALQQHQVAVDPVTMASNRPGLFAIGDIATYPGKLKLILTGFAEAAIAARSAYALVHPETPLHFEYSTTSGVPR
ncbi:MAG: NAD(P)/FAD-dependent oxidoreductase [Proteobacteria bacterium]|nr:NAD(P)/FAD-dependent oxidoreductase [Pseudomonadota bacterium]